MDSKRKTEFVDMYKALCEEYSMYICSLSNEAGTEIWVEIEEALSAEELTEHFKEIESC